jgi:bifunctional DNA-binding transcriptional regulator/antitoxin component of YhaV-PrlF toxin-antitoxin module
MKTTISSKGQIVLPAFRRMDRIQPGQEFEVIGLIGEIIVSGG